MKFLSRRYRNRPYVIGEFTVVGATVHDDGVDALKFDIPLTPKQQGAIADLIGMSEIQVCVLVAVYPKEGAS